MAARQQTKIKDHRVLALDIGSRFIKLADLRFAKGQIALTNIVVSPTPSEMVDEGQILDPKGLGKEIKRLLTENKITTKKVIASVRGQSSVVVRPIELPRMSKKELSDTMKFEVERHIPFAADEIVMDYAPFVDPDDLPETEENMKVLLAVAQEDLINSYIEVIRAAKLVPVAFDVEILSTIRALIDIHQDSGSYSQTVALVNIGASSTDISIVSHGNLVFNRSIRIAGDRLTSAIAEQLGRSLEEAEVIKKESAQVFQDSYAGELPVPQTTYPADTAANGGAFDSTMSWQNDAGEAKPVFSFEDNAPFSLEKPAVPAGEPAKPVDEEPIFRFDTPTFAEDEDQSTDIRPVFSLDNDVMETGTPATAENGDKGPAPVFDISSELEDQLPPPRFRPGFIDFSKDESERAQQSIEAIPAEPVEPKASDITEPAVPVLETVGNVPEQPYLFTTGAPAGNWTDVSAQHDPFKRRVFEAIQPALEELITEIRRSLEYFSNREPNNPIDRLLIYGGTSRLPRLAEFIRHEVGIDVQYADPLMNLDTTSCQLAAEYLQDLAPVLPVCIGLGIRDMIA